MGIWSKMMLDRMILGARLVACGANGWDVQGGVGWQRVLHSPLRVGLVVIMDVFEIG